MKCRVGRIAGWEAASAIGLLLMGLLAGCQPGAPATGGAQATPAAGGEADSTPIAGTGAPLAVPAEPVVFDEPPADDLGGGTLIDETWDALSMQGSPVGYLRTTTAKVSEGGRELVRTRSVMRLVVKREGQPVTQDMTLTSFDTPEGELVRFESRMTMGTDESVVTGAVEGDELTIEVATLGSVQKQTIPWRSEWGGYFALEQSLRRQPLKPGEQRRIRSLMPISNVPADIHLSAERPEPVDLPGGSVKLLKTTSTIELPGLRIETVMWLSERGEPLKQFMPQIGQEVVRTTKELALRPGGTADYDLMIATTVPLKGELPNHVKTKRVVYRARLKSGTIEGLFAEGLSQRVHPIDERTVELTVIAVRPDVPSEQVVGTLRVPSDATRSVTPTTDNGTRSVPTTFQPTADDLAPNSLIQSDDPQVVKLAAAVLPGESDPWKTACALEQYVAGAVRNKNFSQAFATAAEVARSLEGDCTEHAVLLAALCRARGIPARCAFGLVHYPRQRGFAYHMWNEVWIGDRWVPLDGTLGRGGIGGGHIKLADSNLAGASAYTAMLPVIQVLGQLELEVVSVE